MAAARAQIARQDREEPPLPPEILRVIEALAEAQACRDYDAQLRAAQRENPSHGA